MKKNDKTSLIISILALSCTVILTISNVIYFRNQRNDSLNQILYTKKIEASLEINKYIDQIIRELPSNIELNNINDSIYLDNNKLDFLIEKHEELYKNYFKWEIVLPQEVILKTQQVGINIANLLKVYQKINNRISGDTIYIGTVIPPLNNLVNQSKELTASLNESRLELNNTIRQSLGVDPLSGETKKIIDRLW